MKLKGIGIVVLSVLIGESLSFVKQNASVAMSVDSMMVGVMVLRVE